MGAPRSVALAALLLSCAFRVRGQVVYAPPATTQAAHLIWSASRQDGWAQALAGLKATGYSVTVCNRSALDAKVSGGEIVMALERAGVGVIPVAVIVPAATQARSRSGWEIALGVGAEVLFEVGVSGALNFIKVNPAKAVGKLWRAAPLVLGRQLQQVNAARDKVQPDPLVTFRGIYLDTAPLLVPQGCVGRVVASPCAQCPPTAGGEL